MQRAATAWLKAAIDQERQGNPARFAMHITGYAVVMACAVDVPVRCALVWFGLHPGPLGRAVLAGIATTAAITSVVSYMFALVIGRAIRELAIQRDAFEHMSCTDALSGVRNRRAFFESFESATEAGELILIDIDHFKSINDMFGHLVGDEVIRGVGRTLCAVFAGTPAVIGRVGGEEFAVFVPDGAGERRPDFADAARIAIAAMVVVGIDRPVTISLGVAESTPPRPALDAYSAADRALYLAKAGGRNRVVREAETCSLPCLQKAPAAARGSLADAA